MNLVYATSNQDKFREAQERLPGLQRENVDIIEIQGSPREIVADKVTKAYNAIGEPCVVDDASLMIEDLAGSPGPYVKDFLDGLSSERIGALFAGSRAKAVLFLGYSDAETTKLFQSTVEGCIVSPRGEGWGYEPVFQPDGYEGTWAELDVDDIKHRARAIDKLRAWLR